MTSHPAEAATRENGDLIDRLKAIVAYCSDWQAPHISTNAMRITCTDAIAALSTHQQQGDLTASERHELECLRARVQQIEYPCSPHCDGYLRELALRNSRAPQPDTVTEEMEKAAWKALSETDHVGPAAMRAALTAALSVRGKNER